VRNDLIGWRGTPLRVILRRVGVADERGVVPPDERTVERRANAGIGLRTGDDESSHPQARQHGLEVGVLEGVAEILFDQRLSVSRRQLGDDSPFVASPGQILVKMLHPDNGDTFLPCPLHEAADVRHDGVASMGALDDAGLHVDDQQCGVRSVLECGHCTTVARVPRSPEPARREILDAALRIFATNRISAVSMREIRLAAKQRNGGALQYHFGDMDGLLRALIERELPLLTDRRKTLLAVADLAGPDDLWSVAAVWALPYAQLATGSERERYVVRFLSQLHDDTTLPLEKIAGLLADPTTDEAFRLLRERVPDELSDEILSERVQIATNSFVHAASIRASGRASNVSDEEFRTVLVDMFLGALTVVTTKRVET